MESWEHRTHKTLVFNVTSKRSSCWYIYCDYDHSWNVDKGFIKSLSATDTQNNIVRILFVDGKEND